MVRQSWPRQRLVLLSLRLLTHFCYWDVSAPASRIQGLWWVAGKSYSWLSPDICPQVKEDVGSATGRAALNGRQTHQSLDPSSWEARIRKEPALQRAGPAVEAEKTVQGPGALPGGFPAATQRVGHSAPLPCLRSLDTWLLPGPAHVRRHQGVPLCALPMAPASSDPAAAGLLWVRLGQAVALHTSPYVLPEWSLLLELLPQCLTVTTWLFPLVKALVTSFLDSVPSTAFLGRFSVHLGSNTVTRWWVRQRHKQGGS